MSSIAVVTGAGRREGIGVEVARQLGRRGMTVVLTARNGEAARDRAQELAMQGLDVLGDVLDVAQPDSVSAFARRMASTVKRVDVLVNNAAATSVFGETPSTADLAAAHAAVDVTLFGAWRLTQALLPLMSTGARIVNVSSGAGSHGDPQFGLATGSVMGPAYSVAKCALNALTVTFAREVGARGILVNAVCPGFTATFPGAQSMGARPVADGAAGIVWAATLPEGGPSGGFFRDGRALPW